MVSGKTLGYAALGIAAPVAMHIGMDSRIFEGHTSLYDLTDSLSRFFNYGLTAIALGTAINNSCQERNGRPTNAVEKIGSYAIGALAASGLWEGWENIGQIGAMHELLRNSFGDYAKTGFPGSGLESFKDAAYTVGGTTAAVAGAEMLSKGAEYVSRPFRKRAQQTSTAREL